MNLKDQTFFAANARHYGRQLEYFTLPSQYYHQLNLPITNNCKNNNCKIMLKFRFLRFFLNRIIYSTYKVKILITV